MLPLLFCAAERAENAQPDGRGKPGSWIFDLAGVYATKAQSWLAVSSVIGLAEPRSPPYAIARR